MSTKVAKHSLKMRFGFGMNIRRLDTLFIHSTTAIVSRKSKRIIEVKHSSINIDFVDVIENDSFAEIELIT